MSDEVLLVSDHLQHRMLEFRRTLRLPAPMPCMRKWLANVATLVVTSALVLAVAESGLRLIVKYRGGGGLVTTGDQYVFYRYDSTLGWANSAKATGIFERSEFSFPLRINTLGLRGAEIQIAKPKDVRRIAMLGDSFTWGIGAAEPELFSTLVQRRLPGVEVLNLGVAGYAPVQYLLQASAVLALDPDVVVIVFCLGNDFADNVFWQRYGRYKPYAMLDTTGNFLIAGTPPPNVRSMTESAPGRVSGHSQPAARAPGGKRP